ncbi:hypothetical protein QFZ32_005980 [Streptomyces canus]|nr:hypothetical protein [Streptomyces canus]
MKELVAGQRDELDLVVRDAGLLQRPQEDDALGLALGESEPLSLEVLDRADVAAGLGGEEIARFAGDVDGDDLRVESLVVRLDRRNTRVGGDIQGTRAEGVDDIGPGGDIGPARHLERKRTQPAQFQLELLDAEIRGDLQAGTRRDLRGERGGQGVLAVCGGTASGAAAEPGDAGRGTEDRGEEQTPVDAGRTGNRHGRAPGISAGTAQGKARRRKINAGEMSASRGAACQQQRVRQYRCGLMNRMFAVMRRRCQHSEFLN